VLSESLPLDRDLVERSAALLRKVAWNGPAMVEYKMDARDGREKLMEVNGRFWDRCNLPSMPESIFQRSTFGWCVERMYLLNLNIAAA